MISFQTNTDSISAQNNLRINEQFQSNTIQQLTSGYRINSSGDDAAGLAVANGLRDNITELTQGVANANNGVAQLQIVDGGLSNISTILDRMKTLATESASGTFTGNRNTLNQEYTGLIGEINRQASNINLNAGGSLNQKLNVYVGGASNAANANVTVDLSGNKNAVDATSLGLANTSIAGSGGGLNGNALNLSAADASGTKFLQGAGTQIFNFYTAGATTATAVTLNATSSGYTLSQALSNINSQLAGNANTSGITASVDSNGHLQFAGTSAFTVKDMGPSGGGVTNTLTDYSAFIAGGGTAAGQGVNGGNYNYNLATPGAALASANGGDTEKITFTLGSGATVTANMTSANTASLGAMVTAINTATASYGINATINQAGTGISFQSASSFSIGDAVTLATGNTASAEGVFGNTSATTPTAVNYSPTAPPASNNGSSAISALNSAIQNLGLVQGSVGAGENKLQYAINLAQSQISNFSSAESQIRDADVAAEAANLTKSQVLQQSSIAAMAQANQEPQALMKLLG